MVTRIKELDCRNAAALWWGLVPGYCRRLRMASLLTTFKMTATPYKPLERSWMDGEGSGEAGGMRRYYRRTLRNVRVCPPSRALLWSTQSVLRLGLKAVQWKSHATDATTLLELSEDNTAIVGQQ